MCVCVCVCVHLPSSQLRCERPFSLDGSNSALEYRTPSAASWRSGQRERERESERVRERIAGKWREKEDRSVFVCVCV